MSGPEVVKIELTPLHVPFRELVRASMARSQSGLGMAIPADEPWSGGDFVICRLTAEDGSEGLGEAFVWLPETGVSPDQLIDTVEHGLARYLLGASPFDTEALRDRMERNVARCDVAKGLLDMACYDLMGRICGRPAHDLMGGRCVDALPLTALIPQMGVEAAAEMALAFHRSGTRSFRFKLGGGVEEDRRVITAAREALGDSVRFRVDYNQAYTPAEAVRAIRAISSYGIDFAEQPVRASNPLGMVRVARQVEVPLMAHEGCFSLQDIVVLVELGAVGVVGLNAERPGGVTSALRAITYAEQRGLGVVIHNQSLGIGSAMQAHLAAARHFALGHAIELFGHVMMEDDLILEPLDYSGGELEVPAGAGFGVALDEGALDRYATRETVVIEAR